MTPLSALQGLGAPSGAVLAGCREFVTEAWRVRKLLGGGMRQVGVLAAAARLGLQHAEVTLRRDHDNARRFAAGEAIGYLRGYVSTGGRAEKEQTGAPAGPQSTQRECWAWRKAREGARQRGTCGTGDVLG